MATHVMSSHMASNFAVPDKSAAKHMCQKCGKCFTTPLTLKKHSCKLLIPPIVISTDQQQPQHVQQHHQSAVNDVVVDDGGAEGVEYLCGLCNEAFDSVDSIINHMSVEHKAHASIIDSKSEMVIDDSVVSLEADESEIEMMYIPKEEEMVVIGQTTENDINNDLNIEIVENNGQGNVTYKYEVQQNT